MILTARHPFVFLGDHAWTFDTFEGRPTLDLVDDAGRVHRLDDDDALAFVARRVPPPRCTTPAGPADEADHPYLLD